MTEMGLRYGVALAIMVALTGAARAAEPQIDCNNAMAQNDMNICADREFQAADRQLNAAYRKLIAHAGRA